MEPRRTEEAFVLTGYARTVRPAPLRFGASLWAVGAAAAAFAVLGVLAAFFHQQLLTVDEPIRGAIRAVPGVETVLRVLGFAGTRMVVVPLALAAAWLVRRRCPRLAVVLLAVAAAASVLEVGLKTLVDRPRPTPTGFLASFPSGHVLNAVAFWGLVPPVLYVLTRRRQPAAAIAVAALVGAVALSRVYLSAHWPTDVVGSVLLGIVVLAVAERWLLRRPSSCGGCALHPAPG